jgi:hypothetical protein
MHPLKEKPQEKRLEHKLVSTGEIGTAFAHIHAEMTHIANTFL